MSREPFCPAPVEMDLEITPAGVPDNPLLVVPLDEWCEQPRERVEEMAAAMTATTRLTVGVLRRPPIPELEPLLRALTLTVASNAPVELVPVVECDDPVEALQRIDVAVDRCPSASLALGRLLRQTATPDTDAGLAAEAAVYSMLLGGSEFARWLDQRGGPRPVTPPERPAVRVARSGDRLEVVLDHPERRNALSIRMREALLEAVRLADLDPTIGAVDLRGAGPVFCSGGDLDEFGIATDLVAAYLVRLERSPWRIIDRLRDRVVAHVHGACIGAGVEMAAFAGRVVATPDAFFRLPEIEMGLVPGAGGTVSVPRRIGRWRAAWMMLTGAPIDAETALRWGLIDAIESA